MFVTLRRLLTVAVALSFFHAAAQTNTEARLALIIGNASYKLSPLSNPVNDARLMDNVLKEAGFTTIKAENASIREMRRLVRDFGDKLKATGGVGLFYFAGHGVQVRGENFLVSTDSEILNEDEVADDSVNVNVILDKMQSAGNRMNLIILDACRNNPFASKSRSSASGLATINAPSGSLVAYATAPGSVASDGKGQNGLYTEYLAKAMQQTGLPVEEVFKQVRSAVRKASNLRQTPWENTALEGQFFFKPPLPMAATAFPAQSASLSLPLATTEPVMLDMAFWESVKGSQRASELQAYLTQFPSGIFAVLARIRVEEIKTLAATPAKPVVEPKPVALASARQDKLPTVQTSLLSTPVDSATPQKVAVAPIANDVLGDLVLMDVRFGVKTTTPIAILPSETDQTIYSSGDVVGKDGKVLQIRVGEVMLRLVSGSLWTLPLKPATGVADVVVTNRIGEPAGNVSWKTIPLGDGKFRVEAYVKYEVRGLGNGTLQYYGNWTAIYPNQGQLPESSSAVLRGSFNTANMVSAEYKPK